MCQPPAVYQMKANQTDKRCQNIGTKYCIRLFVSKVKDDEHINQYDQWKENTNSLYRTRRVVRLGPREESKKKSKSGSILFDQMVEKNPT